MQNKFAIPVLVLFLTLFSSCSNPLPAPRVVPNYELKEHLAAPPSYNAHDLNNLAKDDQRRMTLLGTCVIKNNAKADWIAQYGDGSNTGIK